MSDRTPLTQWLVLALAGTAVQTGITGGQRGRVVKRR